MTPDLETERLLLRPLQLEDAQQTQPLFAQWEVVQFLNARVPWPYPPDGVRTFYRDVALPAVERGDEWAWTLRLRRLLTKSSAPSASHAARTITAASGLHPNFSAAASSPRPSSSPTISGSTSSASRCSALQKPSPTSPRGEFPRRRACASSRWRSGISSPADCPARSGRSPRMNGTSFGRRKGVYHRPTTCRR